jgi:hypothetical protein
MTAGGKQIGKKRRQGELSESGGVKGDAHLRLIDQEGKKQEKARKKELKAANAAKRKAKKEKERDME